jgi:hypothetical protein
MGITARAGIGLSRVHSVKKIETTSMYKNNCRRVEELKRTNGPNN